jgi:hypothetical protein
MLEVLDWISTPGGPTGIRSIQIRFVRIAHRSGDLSDAHFVS